MRTPLPLFLATLLPAAASLLSLSVRAESKIVEQGSTTQIGSGVVVYDEVIIAGTANVPSSTGWLHVKASSITIEATGVINAVGVGYAGVEGAKGNGANDGAGSGNAPAAVEDGMSVLLPTPGGGGAHIGLGGAAVGPDSCTLFTNVNGSASGGTAYDDVMLPWGSEGLGSPGGGASAGTPNAGQTVAGGNGGGVVILEAATIILAGKIRADGSPAPSAFGAAAGGGAGGSIILISNDFTVVAGAELTATGGSGAAGSSSDGIVIGGSGGGGLIHLAVDKLASELGDLTHAEAGGAGSGGCVDETAAGDGAFTVAAAPDCIDADDDGHPSAVCEEGGDCRDGDPAIYPGQDETCNGIDDDCDDVIDNDVQNCAAGTACVDGACVEQEVDGGVGGGPVVSNPVEIRLGGGLDVCTTTPGQQSRFATVLALLSLVVGAGAWRRHGRRPTHSRGQS